ncbi:HECT-like ubiquitin-conjugating enzyme-binding-domain-containing protein [Favolaschia claudopus]|uniref:HECT-like ubiquitin-conjugating enzyme-binding-domain-containing protein n=1 Tax=Favolaschia claudopus TaxID=2862362 RepID=A0AAW0CWK8_9AGAR
MATLTRTASEPQQQTLNPFLSSTIPSPFPRELVTQESPPPDVQVDVVDAVEEPAGPSRISESNSKVALQELLPSIAYVEKTCIMTLNNLLSGSESWNPIVPDRRHSMPSAPATSIAPQLESPSSSALQTLLTNLRNRDTPDEMVEIQGNTDTALIHELHHRVDQMSQTLEPADAHLAESIVSLLSKFNRLSVLHSKDQGARLTPLEDRLEEALHPSSDLFNTLKRQLSDLQIERQSSQHEPLPPNTPPMIAVEKTLLWSKIDEELEAVVAMCKERTDRFEHLPPQYEGSDYQPEALPQYDSASLRSSIDDSKTKQNGLRSPTLAFGNEKMRLDLEAVTMAIDRLYLVAPQLHNQRVELKSSKLAQMEKARQQGSSPSSVSRGKQKAKDSDFRDLENMLELIGKASERTIKDQSVILDGGMKTRLERARQRDVAKREAFVGHLAEYSDAGRLHGQDAVLQPNGTRTKNPDAMLTLPEFIREAVPAHLRVEDPTAMLTLPEFVKEAPPPHVNQNPAVAPASAIRAKPIRTRSLSAPSFSWLRSTSSRSGLRSEITESVSAPSMSRESTFSVNYIAEHHENLQHILVFLTVKGATPGVDIVAEVLPAGGDAADSSTGGDYLVVKSGAHTSLPLVLPGRTEPGKKQVRVQGSHFEIKLSTLPAANPSSAEYTAPLLDATQLSTANPTSFICASCSLPLVQFTKAQTYKDLPSEHWEELVDAWMCHADQKLNERVMKHGKGGFWPEAGQALVGGSYILFEEHSMVKHHLCPADQTKRGEDWRLVRCICGAVVGRCQEHGSNTKTPNVFRMLKYAIRPVSSATEPSKLPLSAFIVEDMAEFVEAHASYRFIILDEEEERARILIWLFKPNMRLAYTTQTQYSLPRSASIRTAKVLYKLLGPSEATADLPSILNTYPGFPQAEYLFYPMDVCRRLAGLLKESNSSYPESLRTMTGLEVGWLRRA